MTEANRKSQAERSDDASEVPRRGFRTAYRDFSEAVDLAELDLDLARVAILYPGSQRYPLSDRVEVVPLSSLGRGDPLFP